MHASRTSVFDADGRRLAALFDVSAADGAGRLWQDEELGAVLRHQLSAPLRVDLVSLGRSLAGKIETLTDSLGLTLKSFGDLLSHPHPPVELLKLAKNFAKACRISPRSPLPREVATVLYFASVAAALARCRCRITSLTDAALSDGFRWVLDQPWLDDRTRALVREGTACLPGSQEEVWHG